MKKLAPYILLFAPLLLQACGKSQELIDAEQKVIALQEENSQLRENLESIKQDIQNARDNVEQHLPDDANDDLDSAEQKAEDSE